MGTSDEEAMEAVRRLLAEATATLAAAGARDEALAEFVPARRVLGFQRQPAMRPLGRVWRLGVFLLAADGTLRATGGITRAVEPGHPGHVAQSIEDRREHRAAAFRGPFARGETVHYDAPVIELDPDRLRSAPGPLLLRDGRALVRWSAAAGDDAAQPFERYLIERIDLLLTPLQGA
ncbi:MAG: hypothetical protein QOE37_453 [Microbacteriaceae bacterium]|jgi:hypothetical protein|nr:hypothetical protein [Microbacteriaceae bacterium]